MVIQVKTHMMHQMAAYSSNITTELIQKSISPRRFVTAESQGRSYDIWLTQKMMVHSHPYIEYLDENKQLILAILDNQNLGKLNECATYQAKLQQNLMYLAAIADAQPQGGHSSQMQAPAPTMQPTQNYLQQQQQQQQQLMMSQRSAIPSYLQQSQQATQQSFYSQQSMLSGGGGSIHTLLSNERGMGGNGSQVSPGYCDGGRDGNQMGMNLHAEMHGGNGTDLGGSPPLGHRDGGQGNDDSEASYLKGSDGSSL